ncbi:low-density lipoprotein receptor-related protein 12-like isoform X1 [Haliotis rufescens]|uniref:low-density lipoprotein receptor-related protein 12-like isoform X1 n=1 Tax=Haliotis rufescens TaxID=6454 RepID=UPI00201EE049|nr:low-density lipoprotein receptor-related protein 12-like isoform X1 [Haliotis rufescens]
MTRTLTTLQIRGYLAVGALLCAGLGTTHASKHACSKEVVTEPSGEIRSTRMLVYPSVYCKYWFIQAPENATITISFESLNIDSSPDDSCSKNFVEIGPVSQTRYCRSSQLTYIATGKGGHLCIFFSTQQVENNNFALKYIVGKVPQYTPCGSGLRRCSNTKCIFKDWWCNGRNECGDNSDEASCVTTTPAPTCFHPSIVCRDVHTGQQICLSRQYQCDGKQDCLTRVDESHSLCPRTTTPSPHCPAPSMMCYDIHTGTRVCLSPQYQCNGRNDCINGADESPSICQRVTTDHPVCSPPSILCNDVQTGRWTCLKPEYQCNGQQDCTNDADESPALCPQHQACGGVVHDIYGTLTSPRYPRDYPNGKDCEWTIHAGNPGDKVQLRFSSFNLQHERNTDYVSVYNGRSSSSPLIGTYYGGNKPPAIIEVSTNWMFIKFHSDQHYPEQGFNATFQQKGQCIPGVQEACKMEGDCYQISEKCDGVWNCPEHGSDELGCNRCGTLQFSCGSASSCYSRQDRCNGGSQCHNHADEKNCTANQCGSHKGLFLCKNKRCIYETWECDRTDDCDDHSDEDGCPSPFFTRRVIVAAVTGSLICSLLLVIALGCICKVYALRMNEQYGPRHESPLSRLQAEFLRRRAPPPPYHEAMLTSRPYEEARQEYLSQSRDQHRRRSRDRRRNQQLPPTPEEPSSHQIVNETADDHQLAGENDVQLISLNSTHLQNANMDTSSTVELIPPSTSSDSEDSQAGTYNNGNVADDDDNDSVLLDITDGVGLTASWRSLSQRSSDEEQSPEHAPSDPGCDSGDSASASLSVDNMTLTLHESLDKENGVEVSESDPVLPGMDITEKEPGDNHPTRPSVEEPQNSVSTPVPRDQNTDPEPPLIKHQ